jgi:chromosome segregation ATPase
VSRSSQRKPDPAEPEQERVVEALTSLVRTLVGVEIEALSRKLDELDVSLSRRIADLDERVESTLAQVHRDLAADIASARKEGDAAAGKLGERVDACASMAEAVERAFERDMRPRVEALGERIGTSEAGLAEKLRSEIAKQHESHDELVERVQGLTESVKAAQKGIEQQLETSQRLSAVLNTLTSVFTTERTAAIAAATGAAQAGGARRTDSATGATSDPSLGDLDSVLNKLFPR